MSNQAWLEAYEAQKAKRLESLKETKDPLSLSGLTNQKSKKETKNDKIDKIEVKPKPQIPVTPNSTNTRLRKSSIDNSAHERIEAEKLASIEAFSQPMSSKRPQMDQNVSKTEDKKRKVEEPSVHSLFKKVKNDSKKEVKDWQKEYEERKKLAMAALKK